MASFDDLAFGGMGSAGAPSGPPRFCLLCVRTWDAGTGRLCPTCGVPMRELRREDAALVDRVNAVLRADAVETMAGETAVAQAAGSRLPAAGRGGSDAVPAAEVAASTRALNPFLSLLAAVRARDGGGAAADEEAERSSAGPHTRSAASAGAAPSAAATLPPGLSFLLGGGAGGGDDAGLEALLGQLGTLPEGAAGRPSDGLLETLRLAFEGMAEGGSGPGGGSGASRAAVAALQRIVIRTSAAADLPQTHSLLVSEGGGARVAEFVVVPAAFGPSPRDATAAAAARDGGEVALGGRLVIADPLVGGPGPLANAPAFAGGAVAVFERGVTTFASKALTAQVRTSAGMRRATLRFPHPFRFLRAQAAGASAAVVIQTAEAWPYTMTDGAGEATAAGGRTGAPLRIPAVMLRPEDGRRLLREVRARAEAGGAGLHARLLSAYVGATVDADAASGGGAACAVCCEAFRVGDSVALMPCLHPFHDACLAPWLERRHTCPVCRAALRTEHEEEAAAAGGSGAASRGGTASGAAARAARDAREAMVGSWYQ